jgi:hypothetical protein
MRQGFEDDPEIDTALGEWWKVCLPHSVLLIARLF